MKYLKFYNTHDDIINNPPDYDLNVLYCQHETHIHYHTDTYDAIVEYLESTGTQYIDLGAKATQETTIEIECYCVEADAARVFGARTSYQSNAFMVSFTSSTDRRFAFNYDNISNTNDLIFSVYCNDGNWHTIKSNGNGHRQIDNVTKTGGHSNFTTPNNVLLFGYNDNGTIKCGKIRIRKCKFNSLDLIPVRKNGVGYMYDRISGKLFGNNGTGNFIIGPDVYDHRIKYLESTGTQYIDTGYTPVRYDTFTVEFENKATITENVYHCLLFSEGGTYDFAATIGSYGNNPVMYCKYFASGDAKRLFRDYSGEQTLTISDSGVFTVGDVSITSPYQGALSGNETSLFLFANRAKTQWFKGRLKSLKVVNNSLTKLDLIPVHKNGIGYMYDRVTNKLFGNAGTGAFICGPQI